MVPLKDLGHSNKIIIDYSEFKELFERDDWNLLSQLSGLFGVYCYNLMRKSHYENKRSLCGISLNWENE